jgi:uncharacterized protein YndB with AHSA1/START domain
MANVNLVAKPGKQEVTVTCILDGPCELVFKTITDPDLLPHWWGPRGLATTVDFMDVRPGGPWRYVQVDNEGNAYAFHGFYHQVNDPQSLVYTFEFEGTPGHILLETITLEDFKGRTRLIDQIVFQSVADRDGMLNMGMESGSRESMDRLAELLEKAKNK